MAEEMTEKKKENTRKFDPMTVTDRDTGREYYGGDQNWYKSNTMAFAGCGSVAALNMLRNLAVKYPVEFRGSGVSDELGMLTDKVIYKDDYTSVMKDIYKSMFVLELPIIRRLCDFLKRGNKIFRFIPPSLGLSMFGFITGTLRFCAKRGLNLHVKVLPTAFTSYDKGLDFIREGLKKSGSVVMLTSLNRHPLRLYSGGAGELNGGYDQKKGVRSHFMTITGLVEDNPKEPLIKLTTWGRVATVPYSRLNKSWHRMRAYTSCLYYFTPTDSPGLVKADMARSYVVYVWALIKGLLGWAVSGNR